MGYRRSGWWWPAVSHCRRIGAWTSCCAMRLVCRCAATPDWPCRVASSHHDTAGAAYRCIGFFHRADIERLQVVAHRRGMTEPSCGNGRSWWERRPASRHGAVAEHHGAPRRSSASPTARDAHGLCGHRCRFGFFAGGALACRKRSGPEPDGPPAARSVWLGHQRGRRRVHLMFYGDGGEWRQGASHGR